MLDQNANFENLIIGIISLVALIVFGVMLAAAFALLRSESQPRNSGISRGGVRETLESTLQLFERYPDGFKTVNWIGCLVLATCIAWLNYSRELQAVSRTSFHPYLIGLAILSPACLGVAWLRLTGVPWRQAVALLIWVPLLFGGILLIRQLTGAFLSYLGFGS